MNIIAVVVTYNRRELLKRNIACLRLNTPVSSIVVVNNGSTDGTGAWLDEQEDLTVIHQENVGGSGGFYRGIQGMARTAMGEECAFRAILRICIALSCRE